MYPNIQKCSIWSCVYMTGGILTCMRSATLILSLFLPFLACAEEPVTLTVNISGASPNTGQIILSVFDSEADFLKRGIRQQTVPVGAAGDVTIVVDDVPAGTYAISVVWDENSNNEMDTGFMRIPKEKIGFSNNARNRFGPPKFDKTKFELAAPMTMDINLFNAID